MLKDTRADGRAEIKHWAESKRNPRRLIRPLRYRHRANDEVLCLCHLAYKSHGIICVACIYPAVFPRLEQREFGVKFRECSPCSQIRPFLGLERRFHGCLILLVIDDFPQLVAGGYRWICLMVLVMRQRERGSRVGQALPKCSAWAVLVILN